jgi:F-type H+-transporting ATPase subunit b
VLIDWFTVVAQTVNFLVLVWLLKRFFYRPILNAIDARERRIAAELAEADAKKMAGDQQRDEFQRKTHELEQQCAAILSKVLEEAQAERQRLIAAAHEDAAKWRIKWEETWNRDYQALSDTLTRKICAEILATARKVLSDLGSTALEAHIVDVFIRRLREWDADLRLQLASAPTGWTIRSAFDLSPEQKKNIEQVLGANPASGGRPVRFVTEPSLIAGIELVVKGQKIAWTIADYLTSLERDLETLLKNQAVAEHESRPQPETQLERR